MYLTAGFVQLSGYWQRDGAAYAAADHTDLFKPVKLGGLAERTREIREGIALLKHIKTARGRAHDLKDDADGPTRRVGTRNGQRDALAVFGGA